MRRLAFVLLAMCSSVTSGCLSLEQTMTFERNLSGTAGVTMQVDLEPIVGFMATMKGAMSEKPGKPSEADLAAARKELMASMGKRMSIDLEKAKQEASAQLPPGVKLLNATVKEDGLKSTIGMVIGFDDASKLDRIKLEKNPTAAPEPVDNPMDAPFGGLKIVDEGTTILVTSPARNPMAEKQEEMGQMPMDAELKALFDAMFSGIRVVVKLAAPFDVVEHNAHRKEGNTLIWDYNMTSLLKMSAAEVEQGVRVRYRK